MNVATVGPGARLKLERERRGLSLQKAADEMRLDAWVIEALEAEQYDRIGPAVYGKGHLKKYASLLGVSWDDIASSYELRANPAETPPPPTSMRVPTATPRADQLPRGQVAAILLLLLVIAAVLWWKPWQPRAAEGPANLAASAEAESPATDLAGSADPSPANGAVPDAAPGGDGSAGSPGNGSAGTGNGASGNAATGNTATGNTATGNAATGNAAAGNGPMGNSPAASAPPVTSVAVGAGSADAQPGHGSASLRLSFSAESWVDIRDAAGKRVYSGYGHANSVKTVVGEGPLRVYLGYASGVQIEINDHAVAIGTAFLHGDVARFQLGADGILRSFSGNERPRG